MLQELIGAGKKVILGGMEYTVSPFTISDWADLEAYAIATRIKLYKIAEPDASKADMLEIQRLRTTPEELEVAASTIGGQLYQAYLALRRAQPQLTLQEAQRLCDDGGIKAINEAITEVNGFEKNAKRQTPETPEPAKQ